MEIRLSLFLFEPCCGKETRMIVKLTLGLDKLNLSCHFDGSLLKKFWVLQTNEVDIEYENLFDFTT